MGNATKNQFYKYSMRSVLNRDFYYCGANAVLMGILPPDNVLTMESLDMHVRILFGATVSAANQKVVRIGVVNSLPPYDWYTGLDYYSGSGTVPTYHKFIDCDLTADGDRYLDFKCDVTSLINKDDPENNLVYLMVPYVSSGVPFGGTIPIWKLDAIFTTTEIA